MNGGLARLPLSPVRYKLTVLRTGRGTRLRSGAASARTSLQDNRVPVDFRPMGRGQAVRRGTLAPVFGGSNPPAPTSPESREADGMSRGQLKLFSGSAHRALAAEIGEFLGVGLGQARLLRFPDTEVSFQIDENIRGTDVFVVQPTCAPVDEHLVELCVMMDAFRRSSASRITAVIPYYGYARQDRKDKPRVPISAKLVANLLSAAGANRVLTMDLHKAQIQGFFDIPVDHLFAAPVIIDYCKRLAHAEPDDCFAGRRWRRARARLREAARRRAGDHRQAARRRWHGGGDERDRRRRRPHVHHPGRHHRYGRARS